MYHVHAMQDVQRIHNTSTRFTVILSLHRVVGFSESCTFYSNGDLKFSSRKTSDKFDGKYLIPRNALLQIFNEEISRKNRESKKEKIRIVYNTTCYGFSIDDQGLVNALVRNIATGGESKIPANFIIGCDGMNSAVRTWLASGAGAIKDPKQLFWADGERHLSTNELQRKFQLHSYSSLSTGLFYKLIKIQDSFTLPPSEKSANKGEPTAFLSTRHYTFRSKDNRNLNEESHFTSYPQKPGMQRFAAVVRPSSNKIWQIKSLADIKTYFYEYYPQLRPVENIFCEKDLERFVSTPPGVFPKHEHVKGLQATLCRKYTSREAESIAAFTLIGDSAHHSPPDVAQGVNSALADVSALYKALGNNNFELDKSKKRCLLLYLTFSHPLELDCFVNYRYR